MFQNKNANLILSIIIAIILWGYVLIDVNPTVEQSFTNIPVKIQNQETLVQRGLALTNEDYFVSVVIKGKRSDIVKLGESDIVPVMDVYGYALGTNYVPVKIEIPDGLSLANVSDPKLEVIIEEYVVSNRSVEIRFVGELANGKEPGNIVISPKQVEVRGAKSRVESVVQLLAEVRIQDLGTKGETSGEIQPLDKNGSIVSGITLSSTTLSVTGNLLSAKTVPLFVPILGEIPKGYELESLTVSPQVTIVGEDEVLLSITGITAAAIDISSINSTTVLPVELNLPRSVFLSESVAIPTVTIKIKGFDTKTVEALNSQITFIGLDPKLSAYVNTAKISIIMTGENRVLSAIKDSSAFELYLNLQGFNEGTFIVPLGIKHNKSLTNVVVSPSEVQVTINSPNEGF